MHYILLIVSVLLFASLVIGTYLANSSFFETEKRDPKNKTRQGWQRWGARNR